VKISKERLVQIIKEEMEASETQKSVIIDAAQEAIDGLTDPDVKNAIVAYIELLKTGAVKQ